MSDILTAAWALKWHILFLTIAPLFVYYAMRGSTISILESDDE